MAYYYDKDQYLKAGYTPIVIGDGSEPDIGDKLVNNQHITDNWKEGVECKVIGFTDYLRLIVEFDVPDGVGTNSFDEHGKRGYCYAFDHHHYDYFSRVEPETDDDAEARAVKDLTLALQKQPNVTQINGTFYTLAANPIKDIDELVKNMVAVFKNKIMTIRRAANNQIRQEREKIAQVFVLPALPKDTIEKEKIITWSDGNLIYFSLPFTFAPQFIANDREPANRVISETHQAALKKQVYMIAQVNRDWYIVNAYLSYDQFGKKIFDEFCCHGELDSKRNQWNFAGVLSFRNDYEVFCHVISRNHIQNDRPNWEEGMPSYAEIRKNSRVPKDGEVWGRDKATNEYLGFHLGDHVKVINPVDGRKGYVGSVGEVIDFDRKPKARLPIKVSFVYDKDPMEWFCEATSLVIDNSLPLSKERVKETKLAGSDKPGEKGWTAHSIADAVIAIAAPASVPDEHPDAPFHVGDLVQINEKNYPGDMEIPSGRGGVHNGEIGKVYRVLPSDNPRQGRMWLFNVAWEKRYWKQNGWSCHEEELQLAIPRPEPALEKPLQVDANKKFGEDWTALLTSKE